MHTYVFICISLSQKSTHHWSSGRKQSDRENLYEKGLEHAYITEPRGDRKDLKKKLLLSSNGHKKGTEKTYFFFVSVVSSIVAPIHSIVLLVSLLRKEYHVFVHCTHHYS